MAENSSSFPCVDLSLALEGTDLVATYFSIRVTIVVAYTLVFALGFTGNALLIYANWLSGTASTRWRAGLDTPRSQRPSPAVRRPTVRESTPRKSPTAGLFMANLALSDLLFCFFSIPAAATTSLNKVRTERVHLYTYVSNSDCD